MKKFLFILPLSLAFASEERLEPDHSDKYVALLSEFRENLDEFRDKVDEEFHARFNEAWTKKYPDIIFTEYGVYDGEKDEYFPAEGVSKSSGKVYEWKDLSNMVMEVWNSVVSEEDSKMRRILPHMRHWLNMCINPDYEPYF